MAADRERAGEKSPRQRADEKDARKRARAKRPTLRERLRRVAAAAAEPPEETFEARPQWLSSRSRRDFLLFGAGILVTAATGWWLR